MKLKNKQGRTSGSTIFFGVIVVMLLLAVLYGVFKMDITGNGIGGGSSGCQIAPGVNLIATNTLVPGTSPAISANYTIYDGSYVGAIPSSLAYGKSLDVLATATNYLNTEARLSSLKCDSNDMKFEFVPYQIADYKIFDDSLTQLSDGIVGGTANQSSSANTITVTLRVSGTPDKSTGDMLVTVDFSNKTQVSSSKIDLAGARRVSNPTWFTPAGTGSAVASFVIPAIVDGGTKDYALSFTPESGMTIGDPESSVQTTIYALEPIILDTNTGTFQTENTWEDSLGASKVIASDDYDFIIT